MYKVHMDKPKGVVGGWEAGMDGARGHDGVKMEKTVLEKQ